MSLPDCDLAIVGGGPAGAATALFLCAAAPELSERVVLLDKKRFPRDKICAGAIGARADRLLEGIGVRVEVPAAPIRGLSVSATTGAQRARLPGAPIGRVVRRVEFDAALLDQVRARKLRVHDGVAVRALSRNSHGVTLDTSAGALSARAVVGADGVGSLVRRAAGLPRGRYHAQALEVDTPWYEGDAEKDLLCFDVSDRTLTGYAWDFPTIVNGESMVCRGLYQLTRGAPASTGPSLDERFRRRLAAQGIESAPLRFKRFAERGLALHSPTAIERVLLVGEAAGIDPVLGEGIPQAIFYGKAAASYLSRCLREREFGFFDWSPALRRARVGLDLSVRAAAVPFFYGRARPVAESWVVSSRDLAVAGMCYFGGRRVPRTRLAGALADLARAAIC